MQKKIILNYDFTFPELAAHGVEKWYVFQYDEFFNSNCVNSGPAKTDFLSRLTAWGRQAGIHRLTVDVFRYYDCEDFLPFSKAEIEFKENAILSFFEKSILGEQSLELFVEEAYLTDLQNIVIYLVKKKLGLIGLTSNKLIESFESINPLYYATLEERLIYLFDWPAQFHPELVEIKRRFLENYNIH